MSFITCTIRFIPGCNSSKTVGAVCPRGQTMSLICKKAVRDKPISMNAACIPGRTRTTLPLYTLPTKPRLIVRSTNISLATVSSTNATRHSIGVTLMSNSLDITQAQNVIKILFAVNTPLITLRFHAKANQLHWYNCL